MGFSQRLTEPLQSSAQALPSRRELPPFLETGLASESNREQPLRLTREANEFMLARNDVLDGRG